SVTGQLAAGGADAAPGVHRGRAGDWRGGVGLVAMEMLAIRAGEDTGQPGTGNGSGGSDAFDNRADRAAAPRAEQRTGGEFEAGDCGAAPIDCVRRLRP